MTNFLIFGDDSPRTLLLAQHLPQSGDHVWLAARQQPTFEPRRGVQLHWIQVDLHERGAGGIIANSFSTQALDVCIYNSQMNPDAHGQYTSEQLTALQLTTTILCIQKLLPNLRQAVGARILFIGPSTPNLAEPTRTQLGIRDVAHTLRDILRAHLISVTCLYAADDFLLDDSPASEARRHDLLALVRCLISLSAHSAVLEVDLAQL
jgi:short-subunit dehydrogenase